jgi:hypothetical protein
MTLSSPTHKSVLLKNMPSVAKPKSNYGVITLLASEDVARLGSPKHERITKSLLIPSKPLNFESQEFAVPFDQNSSEKNGGQPLSVEAVEFSLEGELDKVDKAKLQ